MPLADIRGEIPRTFFHVLGGLFLGVVGFTLPEPLNKAVLGILFLTAVTVDTARLRSPGFSEVIVKVIGPFMRPSEKTSYTGSPAFTAGFLLSFFLFPKQIALAAVVPLVIGDRAAVLVGKSWGSVRIGNKTLEGSLACFVSTLLAYYLGAKFLPALLPFHTLYLAGAALAATVVEMLPRPFNDNLTIPLAAGALLAFLT